MTNSIKTGRTLHTHDDLCKLVKSCHAESWFKPGKVIIVNDKMQYGKYTLSANIGRDFDPEFKPELTPKQMLELGVFEGKYLNDCVLEFPREWFTAKALARMSPEGPNPQLNYYKIKSRLSLVEWRKRKWIGFKVKTDNKIIVDQNVRGWFQWYCRYYIGWRIPEIDKIQIKRWNSFKRHLAQVKKNCKHCHNGKKICNDQFICRPKQRQALIQWAYDARKV
ncbi:Hypothetical protein PACV_373 [Pacmanvirus A23]|uniref:Hypothetical protein n=1 Tax=Pacmanvirus A23 TaxID=1932881 RepID=UPI000A09282B|nr:Hypothetical protein B9W72_gp369 [Pacmanvirus A23]SIP86086.1 Hypothetical protein PACV_373 [Pacmanvirus A23]